MGSLEICGVLCVPRMWEMKEVYQENQDLPNAAIWRQVFLMVFLAQFSCTHVAGVQVGGHQGSTETFSIFELHTRVGQAALVAGVACNVTEGLPCSASSAHDSCPCVCKKAAPAAITSSPHCYRRKPAGATEPLFPFQMSGLTSLVRLAPGHLWLQGSKSGYQGLPEKKKRNSATVDITPGCPFM